MRIVVMSDMHFGVPETSLNDQAVRRKIIGAIEGLQPIDRIVLLGDIFDLNLARLGDAIDGRSTRAGTVVGLRQFLRECFEQGITRPQWLYIPGNHDYDTFDVPARLEGMTRRFRKKTDEKILLWPAQDWDGGTIAPRALQGKFLIQYPHRWEKVGGKYVLLTHGHYLDSSQTMGKRIDDLDKPGNVSADKFFTLCAQWQALTRSISYQGETIKLFGSLYKAWASVNALVKDVLKFASMGLFRGKALDRGLQNAALMYIKHFGAIGKPADAPISPDVMIFGHTHKEGMLYLDGRRAGSVGLGKGVLLVNDGGFIHDSSDGDKVGSLVEVEGTAGSCRVRLHVFTRAASGEIVGMVEEKQVP